MIEDFERNSLTYKTNLNLKRCIIYTRGGLIFSTIHIQKLGFLVGLPLPSKLPNTYSEVSVKKAAYRKLLPLT